MSELRLAVKREYFEQIKSGKKTEEYRLANEYWSRRLLTRDAPYDRVIITLGYPSKNQTDRILTFPYAGFWLKTITHKHFGVEPVEVFAIVLKRDPLF